MSTLSRFFRTLLLRPRSSRQLQPRTGRPGLERLEDRVTPSLTPGPTISLASGSEPISVVVGDFNNDGMDDLATADRRTGNVSVALRNGASSFAAPVSFAASSSTGLISFDLAVGDFNSDTKKDIVTTGDGNLHVLLGNGSGSFAAPVSIPLAAVTVVVVGDLDGDGDDDIAAATQDVSGNGRVSVLLGNGAGSFTFVGHTVVTTQSLTNLDALAVGDFDADGKDDVAVGNYPNNSVSVLLSTSGGSFAAPVEYAVGQFSWAVAVGDFNGDGKDDLVSANLVDQSVSVLLGDGAGAFATAATFATRARTSPITVVVGDFNGDAKDDIATVNPFVDSFRNSVSVFLGDGIGSFAPAIVTILDANIPARPVSAVAGNFDGEGGSDLAFTFLVGDNVRLLLNSSWSSVVMAEPGPTPTYTGSANARYVQDLYRSLLAREADASGLSNWVGSLDSGTLTHAQVVDAFFTSQEHRTRQVQRLYNTILARTGDAAGVQVWVSALLNGTSEEEVALNFLLSAEYQQAYSANADFVASLYPTLLNRAGDAGGQGTWTTFLNNGGSRRDVAVNFLRSAEMLQGSLRDFYLEYFGRAADASGLDFWVGQAQQNGEPAVVRAFLSSPEFINKVR